MTTIDPSALATVTGGAQLDPKVPLQQRDRVLAQCAPQLDAYTHAKTTLAANPNDARAELGAAAAGRSLALCATNQGFPPLPEWRYAGNGK
ncbi:MAG TPA: hypothetical protein VMJ10_14255 [Kofleriaceae bacterium]|nr:hypothetical protein [Kofleriaceae bacterium]